MDSPSSSSTVAPRAANSYSQAAEHAHEQQQHWVPSWRRRTLEDVVRLLMLKKSKQQRQPADSHGGNDDDDDDNNSGSNTTTIMEDKHGITVSVRAHAAAPSIGTKVLSPFCVGGDSTVEAPRPESEDTGPVDIMEAAGYATMTWWQCGMLMVAETVSLGILALPRAMATLGLVAGITVLLFMGLMATYTGYVIGQFALVHRSVQSMTEAGEIILGRFGKHLCFWGANGFIVFVMGSHLLVFRRMMDALTDNQYCAMAWTALAFLVSFIFCMPRRCRKMVLLSTASFVSIFSAVVVVIVDVVMHRPAGLQQPPHPLQKHPHPLHEWQHVRAWPMPGLPFFQYFNSILSMTFAYAGHVAFYVFIAELRDRRDFTKALAFLQISDITMYTVTGVVIYVFAGDHVKAPALESASPLFEKIAYGLASVTIVIAGVINGHVVVKALYKLYFAKTPSVMGENTCRARLPWYVINAALWLLAYLLAESIPVFNSMVGLSGAVFASWFTFGIPSFYWFHMAFARDGGRRAEPWGDKLRRWRRVMQSWNKWSTWLLFALNCFIVAVAVAICVIGIYASAMNIKSEAGTVGRPFSCRREQ